MKKNQSKLRNTITEMKKKKKTTEGINNRVR